jgi:hypothetical protein
MIRKGVISAALLLPVLVSAQTIRCGSKLISLGSSQVEVTAQCGDPTQVNHSAGYQGTVRTSIPREVIGGSVDEVQVEIWIYNFGPNKLMQRIRFENGIVTGIDSLGYGF